MKANELMIGDWLFFGNNPTKVTYDLFMPGHLTCSYNPITLTEDILKDNGFERNWLEVDDNHNIQYDWSNNHLRMYSVVFGEYKLYFDMCILYVQELQHALRLCGLNDLADNFKINK